MTGLLGNHSDFKKNVLRLPLSHQIARELILCQGVAPKVTPVCLEILLRNDCKIFIFVTEYGIHKYIYIFGIFSVVAGLYN